MQITDDIEFLRSQPALNHRHKVDVAATFIKGIQRDGAVEIDAGESITQNRAKPGCIIVEYGVQYGGDMLVHVT